VVAVEPAGEVPPQQRVQDKRLELQPDETLRFVAEGPLPRRVERFVDRDELLR
jgi:hypothetical protein